VYKAEKIIKLHNDTSKAGMTGNLYCTNFRLSFVTHSIEEDSDVCFKRIISLLFLMLANF